MNDKNYLDRAMESVRRDVLAIPLYMLATYSLPLEIAQK